MFEGGSRLLYLGVIDRLAGTDLRYSNASLVLLFALLGCSADPSDSAGTTSEELGVPTDRCRISGAGQLAAGDVFSGAMQGGEAGVDGSWQHVTADGSVALGGPEWIVCRINGVLLGDLGGPATWQGQSGYQFLVSVQDLSTGADELREGATQTQTISATRHVRPSRWEDGEVAIDYAARVTIPSTLEVVEGDALGQTALLTFERYGILDTVRCTYRGTSSTHYEFKRCTGEVVGSPQVTAGSSVDVNWMKLRARTAKFTSTQITVSVDLLVTALLPPQGDFYHFVVGDAAGQTVFETEGYLESGDILVEHL